MFAEVRRCAYINHAPLMNTNRRHSLSLAAALAAAWTANGADFLDLFKRKPATNQTSPSSAALGGLSQDQMVGGLKEALGKGVQQAVATLGKSDGYGVKQHRVVL